MVPLTMAIIFGSNPAWAAADDFTVSVGALSWYNRYVPISRLEGLDVPKGSCAFMNGPTIEARYKKLLLGVTWLHSSNDYELVNATIPYGRFQTHVTSSAPRMDLDVTFGYMLTPHVDVHVGYKGIFIKDTLTLTAARGVFYAKHDETYRMGALGTGIRLPLGLQTTVSLTGNALLGAFDNNITYPGRVELLNDSDRHSTAWGASAEGTLTYRIINGLSTGIGVRYQYTKAGHDNSNFLGPTVQINYRF